MTRSTAEQTIRDAVVARLRVIAPAARIVHELNVAGQGTNRIDVAAVLSQAIVAVEIKSERDKLDRLGEQWPAFKACCHHVVVAAHEKHFAEYKTQWWPADKPGEMMLNHPLFFGEKGWNHDLTVWRFPRPEAGRYGRASWSFDPVRDAQVQPRATDMLGMLWADELRAECVRHRLAAGTRRTRYDMILEMAWVMTGREICEAVCRQLRGRAFVEADPPVTEPARVMAGVS